MARSSSSLRRCSGWLGQGRLPVRSASSATRSTAGAASFDTVFGALGIPYVVEQGGRFGDTALGRAALGIMRFAWLDGRRGDLFRYLRSPFSGLERRSVDFVEGRLRGRAIADPARVEEESEKLRGAPLPALAQLRAATEPIAATRELVRQMTRNAWGLESPPTTNEARADARALQAAIRTLDELEALASLDRAQLAPEDVVAALERTSVRSGRRRRRRVRRRSRLRAGAHAHVRRRLPARPRRGQLSASRPPVAVSRRRPARGARRPPRARRPRGPRSLPASTRPARARASGWCSYARRRPTTACPASRARSGTTSARSSTRGTSAARRSGGRSRASPGRSSRPRASASACARWRVSRSTTRRVPQLWPRRTAGRAGSSERKEPSTARPRS